MKGLAIFLVVALLLAGGLYATGAFEDATWWKYDSTRMPTSSEVITETRTVEAQGARSALVELRMGAGRVTVRGGASSLMTATYSYNVPSWKPVFDYVVTNGKGRLLVRGPSGTISFNAGYRYDWDILLSNSTRSGLRRAATPNWIYHMTVSALRDRVIAIITCSRTILWM